MDSTTSKIVEPSQPSMMHTETPTFVKNLTESQDLTSIPSTYTFTKDPLDHVVSDSDHQIPTIDYSLLLGTPDERSKVIHELARACQDWGFFKVKNHGISEDVMEAMIEGCREFFDLKVEEKREYAGKHVMDPIRCGTSFNTSVDKGLFWRDFLKVFVHPEFHSPRKPAGFSELLFDYSKRVREVTRQLLKAISESLGLEADYIENVVNMKDGLQVFAANLYPPCPQPERAMGMPPHSDHGLLTLLMQNETNGLQIQHNRKWFNVNGTTGAFLVNTGDQLEILSNGKYKSVLHRAVVNNRDTRISIAVAQGPSLTSAVTPILELINSEFQKPSYIGMQYWEYLQLQQSNPLDGKSCLDNVRVLQN